MSHGPIAQTLVVCVGLPLKEVAALAASVAHGTLVMAASDVETARTVLAGPVGQPMPAVSSAAAGTDAAATIMTPRGSVAAVEPEPIRVGRLTIDPPVREVLAGDQLLRMSAREFDLLTLLASDLHRVWPFGALVKALWHTDYLGDHEQLASTVKRLRKRLGPNAGCEVHSVHGVGYRLQAVDAAVA